MSGHVRPDERPGAEVRIFGVTVVLDENRNAGFVDIGHPDFLVGEGRLVEVAVSAAAKDVRIFTAGAVDRALLRGGLATPDRSIHLSRPLRAGKVRMSGSANIPGGTPGDNITFNLSICGVFNAD